MYGSQGVMEVMNWETGMDIYIYIYTYKIDTIYEIDNYWEPTV